MKMYLLYIRKYSIFANDYVLHVYRVTTDNVYRVIGKIYCTSMERIECIDYVPCKKETEDFWREHGIEIFDYREPRLSEDN